MTQTLTRPAAGARGSARFREEERVVLMADVNGFSQLAQRIDDTAMLAEFFQATYEVVGDAVVRAGGQVLKYLGDAVLCLFPEGSELAAVRAGQEMRRQFEAVAERFGQQGQTGLKVQIGSGPLQVGEAGHASLRGLDAFGPELFNAVSLQTKKIALTERARERLERAGGGSMQFRALPDLQKPWQAEPIRAWELVE
jgi:adenylate cyclase